MWDSLAPSDHDADAPYSITIHAAYVETRTLRFQTYLEAFAHSYRHGYAPIYFSDQHGVHLCEHLSGQERYAGYDPEEVSAA